MANPGLRLRVDAPYPGESMSSFLSRTAQFYAMPATVLLRELLGKQGWPSVSVLRDLDLQPPSELEEQLSEAVPGWKSPHEGHQGFMGWTAVQDRRLAYCPTCFEEDLDSGKTPYFRNDWIPVFVTTCWAHKTPLFDWQMRHDSRWRGRPKSWIYKMDGAAEDIPTFMQDHLGLLASLGDPETLDTEICEGLTRSQALTSLRCLQRLVEKPSAELMPEERGFQSQDARLRHQVQALVRLVTRHELGFSEPPIAMAGCEIHEQCEWFGPFPTKAVRRHNNYMDFGIRVNSSVCWRRSYLAFVSRTLLGVDRIKAGLPEVPTASLRPWREWWRMVVYPRLGTSQRKAMDSFSRITFQEL